MISSPLAMSPSSILSHTARVKDHPQIGTLYALNIVKKIIISLQETYFITLMVMHHMIFGTYECILKDVK